jgi:hypothetical protein
MVLLGAVTVTGHLSLAVFWLNDCMSNRLTFTLGLVGKPGGTGSLGTPRRRREDNSKKGLQEVRCGGMDWIYLTQDRKRCRALLNVVMKLQVP